MPHMLECGHARTYARAMSGDDPLLVRAGAPSFPRPVTDSLMTPRSQPEAIREAHRRLRTPVVPPASAIPFGRSVDAGGIYGRHLWTDFRFDFAP